MQRTEGLYYEVVNGVRRFKNGPPATIIEDKFLNSIQEEICTVVENAGIAVYDSSNDTYGQLDQAIRRIANIYDKIVASQADFVEIIERVAANRYQIKSQYTSVYFKYLAGGYLMTGATSPLSAGDVWGRVETNQCSNLIFDGKAYLNFGTTIGYVLANTNNGILQNVDVQGDVGVASAIQYSYYVSGINVLLMNCKTSLRNSNTTFNAFKGDAAFIYAKVLGAQISYITATTFRAFRDLSVVSNAVINNNTADTFVGISTCSNVSNIYLNNNTSTTTYYIAFDMVNADNIVSINDDPGLGDVRFYDTCDQLTNIYVGDFDAQNNVNLFVNSTRISNVHIYNISFTAATADPIYLFDSCTDVANVTIRAFDTIGSGNLRLFNSCQKLSNIDFGTIVSVNSQLFCFYSCNDISNVKINSLSNDTFIYVFSSCSNINEIYFADNSVTSNNQTVYVCSTSKNIKGIDIGTQAVRNFQIGNTSNNLSDIYAASIDNDITSMSLFSSCRDLNNIRIDQTRISTAGTNFNIFFGCINISNIYLFDAKDLTGGAGSYSIFSGCDQVSNFYLSGSTTATKTNIFLNCSNVSNVELINLVSTGANIRAFETTDRIVNVKMTNLDAITTISAFYDCEHADDIYITDINTAGIVTVLDTCKYFSNIKIDDILSTGAATYAIQSSNEICNCYINNLSTSNAASLVAAVDQSTNLSNFNINTVTKAAGAGYIYAFSTCNNISNTYINDLTTSGTGAAIVFYSCNDVEGSYITNINSIGAGGFVQCFNACKNVSDSRITTVTTSTACNITTACENVSNINILNFTANTFGGNGTFHSSKNLSNITIDTLTSAAGDLKIFNLCTNVNDVHITSATVTLDASNIRMFLSSINCSNIYITTSGKAAGAGYIYYFESCKHITKTYFNNCDHAGTGNFRFFTSTNYVDGAYITDCSVTTGLLNIGNTCENLNNIETNNIDSQANLYLFDACMRINNVKIYDTLTTDGDIRVFNACNNIENIKIDTLQSNKVNTNFHITNTSDNISNVTLNNLIITDAGANFWFFFFSKNIENIKITNITSNGGDQYLFYSCNNCSDIEIYSITSADVKFLFASCINVENVYIHDNTLTKATQVLFNSTVSISNIKIIDNTLTNSNIFYLCNNICNIHITTNTNIANYFNDCDCISGCYIYWNTSIYATKCILDSNNINNIFFHNNTASTLNLKAAVTSYRINNFQFYSNYAVSFVVGFSNCKQLTGCLVSTLTASAVYGFISCTHGAALYTDTASNFGNNYFDVASGAAGMGANFYSCQGTWT